MIKLSFSKGSFFMRKICISLLFLFIIILTTGCNGVITNHVAKDNAEFLRIHVRANSNSDEDQDIKYYIKDRIVSYLTPFIANCHSKNDAAKVITQKRNTIEYLIDGILKENGLDYSSHVFLRNEKFPTRVYDGITLSGGYYDAVIVELGKAEGENWWCVVYPPLCFTSGEKVKYSSKILEIINEFKRKFGL